METAWKPCNSIARVLLLPVVAALKKNLILQVYENIKIPYVYLLKLLVRPLNLAQLFCYINALIRKEIIFCS